MIVVYFKMHWMPWFKPCAELCPQNWPSLFQLLPTRLTGTGGLEPFHDRMKRIEMDWNGARVNTDVTTANALQRQEFGTIGASTSRVGAFVEEGSWSVHQHGVSLAQLGLCWPISVLPLFLSCSWQLFNVIWIYLNFWHSEAKRSIRSLSRRHDLIWQMLLKNFSSRRCVEERRSSMADKVCLHGWDTWRIANLPKRKQQRNSQPARAGNLQTILQCSAMFFDDAFI